MTSLPQKHNAEWKSPFYEMERFHRDLNRFFEAALPGNADADSSLLAGYWSPAVDVVDRKDSILVRADLPGIRKEDLDVSIEENVLTIRGEKKHAAEHKEGDVLRSERYFGSFYRSFTLPMGVDSNKVSAKFDNGVLELTVNKKEESKPKQIKIDVH